MKRLIEELPDGFEASLLRSSELDRGPTAEVRSRALDAAVQVITVAGATTVIAGSGVASAATAIGTAASTAAAGGGALTGTTLAATFATKAWVVSVLAGVTLLGTVGVVANSVMKERPAEQVHERESVPSEAPVAPLNVAPKLEPAQEPETANAEPTVPPPRVPRIASRERREAVAAPPSANPAPASNTESSAPSSQDELADEIARIDRARAALARHQPDEALRLLGEYDQRHPQASLSREAALLRIEALSARGDRAEAALLAQKLLDANPDGPYRARLRKLLDQSRP